LAEFCEKHGATPCDSFDSLMSQVDAVDVCLPTHLHRDYVMGAIAAGKAVLVEKPMGRTVDECRDMIRASEQAGTLLAVAHVVRNFPEHRKAHQMVVDGAVGTPAAIRMRRGGRAPKGSDMWFQ